MSNGMSNVDSSIRTSEKPAVVDDDVSQVEVRSNAGDPEKSKEDSVEGVSEEPNGVCDDFQTNATIDEDKSSSTTIEDVRKKIMNAPVLAKKLDGVNGSSIQEPNPDPSGTTSSDQPTEMIAAKENETTKRTTTQVPKPTKVATNSKPSAKKTKKTKGKEETSDLEFTWICTECREAECLDDPDAVLLICEGLCNRPFHPTCANLLSPPPDNETWICQDCEQGRHQCAACHNYGQDDVDVYCCNAKNCGLFFHEACLSMYNVDVQVVEEEQYADDDTADLQERTIVSMPMFKCPAHSCFTCQDDIPMLPSAVEDSNSSNKTKRGSKKQKSGTFSSMWGRKKERLFVSDTAK